MATTMMVPGPAKDEDGRDDDDDDDDALLVLAAEQVEADMNMNHGAIASDRARKLEHKL
jgi:hypothetical protein